MISNRKERQKRREDKIFLIKQELIEIMRRNYDQTGDFEFACLRADDHINRQSFNYPTESHLYESAGYELLNNFEEVMDKLRG